MGILYVDFKGVILSPMTINKGDFFSVLESNKNIISNDLIVRNRNAEFGKQLLVRCSENEEG